MKVCRIVRRSLCRGLPWEPRQHRPRAAMSMSARPTGRRPGRRPGRSWLTSPQWPPYGSLLAETVVATTGLRRPESFEPRSSRFALQTST
eukprot:6205407-Pyramimonas_sp.AAC.1